MVAQRSTTIDWRVGGGEMGKLIRSMDWSKTPLGPIAAWPQSPRTTVSLCPVSKIPWELMVKELVSNALKHAFSGDRTGTIQVSFATTSQEVSPGPYPLTLRVCDDGIGLPPSFDPEASSTLGISLVQGLVEQIQGEMCIDCDRHQGTEVRIYFRGGRF